MICSAGREPLRKHASATSDALGDGSQRSPATLVSVVIPTRDRPHLLPQALDSVAAQSGHERRLQLIVADNASQPAVASIAQDYGAEYVATSAVGPAAVRN